MTYERSGPIATMENQANATNGEEQRNNSPAASNAEHQDVEEKNESKTTSVLLEKGQIEERFKIDRKKLEKMIVAGDHGGESAADYFDRIMKETGTTILWPSKLKIGAKSKKDPQVKVIGFPEPVEKAKELICKDLDTKSNRVTLKMEVSHMEHSHIIGKGGANVKKVMQDTKCHIHFPDSNREGMYSEKSNQVSIAGSLPQVEKARQSIRELSPIFLWIELLLNQGVNIADHNAAVEEVMTTYNVNVQIKPTPHRMSMQLLVRGTQMHFDGLKLAVSKLVELFTGEIYGVRPVVLNLDIGPQLHSTLIGKEGGNIRKIMDATDTSIQFPDPRAQRKGQVSIYGTLDGVFAARHQLLGCLPLVLMFDLPDESGKSIRDDVKSYLMQQLDVFISVREKPRQSCISVIVKSIEQNAHCVYQARDQLLQALTKGEVDGKISPVRFDGSVSWRDPDDGSAGFEESFNAISHFSQSQRKQEGLNHSEVQDSATTVSPNIRITNETVSSSYSQMQKQPSSQVHPVVNPFADYTEKKQKATKAIQHKVTFKERRVPQDEFCGAYFSASMPGQVVKEAMQNPAMMGGMNDGDNLGPRGLSSLNKTGWEALNRSRANSEQLTVVKSSPTNIYRDVTDLATLLKALKMEKYGEIFQKEEIDLDLFLTMSEEEFAEIGITTLGARRRLSNAIKEMRQQREGGPKPSILSISSKMISSSGRF